MFYFHLPASLMCDCVDRNYPHFTPKICVKFIKSSTFVSYMNEARLFNKSKRLLYFKMFEKSGKYMGLVCILKIKVFHKFVCIKIGEWLDSDIEKKQSLFKQCQCTQHSKTFLLRLQLYVEAVQGLTQQERHLNSFTCRVWRKNLQLVQ